MQARFFCQGGKPVCHTKIVQMAKSRQVAAGKKAGNKGQRNQAGTNCTPYRV